MTEVPSNGRVRRHRAYCELDRWGFDPRYTGGVCPICGWVPDGMPTAPGWILALRKLDWEVLGLLLLMVALVVLGGLIAYAAGLAQALGRI